MSEYTGQGQNAANVQYELIITQEEAVRGASRVLQRNNKRLQVNIPGGVTTGSVVKLTNALQVTDGRPGDILVKIKIKSEEQPPQTESTPEGVIEVTDSNFDSEVLNSKFPVVVDFWAPWCVPCRMMAPIMGEASQQYEGKMKFCKLNVDENPASAQRFQAMSIPMLLFFKNGQMVEKSVGAISAPQLRAKIEAVI